MPIGLNSSITPAGPDGGVRSKAKSRVVPVLVLVAALCAAGPSAADEAEVHADLRAQVEDDDVEMIVKATSAVAMAKACSANVRLVDKYAGSVAFLLKSNDEQFGAGTSDADVARKIKEHEDENDCRPLSKAHASGLYKNVFLEAAK